jgi:hypothetical protein
VDTTRTLQTAIDAGLQVGLLAHSAARLGASCAGPPLAVRPHRHADHYRQVCFDAMGAASSAFGEVGRPAPATSVATRAA